MSNFIEDEKIKHSEKQYEEVEEETKQAYNEQILNRNHLLDKVAKILLVYTIADSVLSLSKSEQDKEFKSLSVFILNAFKGEYKAEKGIIEGVLNKCKDTYNYNSYLLSLGIDFKLQKLDSKILEKIINRKVEGDIWSDRLWKNKDEMSKILQQDIKDFLEGKIDVNTIHKKIKDRFNQNAYNTKRLVNTEFARVQNEVNEEWFKDNGIEYYLYSAKLEGNTCSKCSQYDGISYKKGESRPNLPQHPNCRCTYIGIPSKEYRPPTKRQGETIKKYQTYEEWKKENNIS